MPSNDLLIYLLCDDKNHERSLFDLNNSEALPVYKPSGSISNVENEIPVSLHHDSQLVLVGDYSATCRSPQDNRLSSFPIVDSNATNLSTLRDHITPFFKHAFASQSVVDWIYADQLKSFERANISPVFVHLTTQESNLHFKTNAILCFLRSLSVNVIELSKEDHKISDLSTLVKGAINTKVTNQTPKFTSLLGNFQQNDNDILDSCLFLGQILNSTNQDKQKTTRSEGLFHFNNNIRFMTFFH